MHPTAVKVNNAYWTQPRLISSSSDRAAISIFPTRSWRRMELLLEQVLFGVTALGLQPRRVVLTNQGGGKASILVIPNVWVNVQQSCAQYPSERIHEGAKRSMSHLPSTSAMGRVQNSSLRMAPADPAGRCCRVKTAWRGRNVSAPKLLQSPPGSGSTHRLRYRMLARSYG
jgi:hypothetical protein